MLRPTIPAWSRGTTGVNLAMLVVVATLIAAAPSGSAPPAQLVSLAPVVDTWIGAPSSAPARGRADALRLDGSPGAVVLMRFDLRGIRGRVVGATLDLRARTDSLDGVAVHAAEPAWLEAAVDAGSRPDVTTRITDESGPFGAGDTVHLDVTALAAGQAVVCLALTARGGSRETFGSRESVDPPRLVLTVTPAGTATPGHATRHLMRTVELALGDQMTRQ